MGRQGTPRSDASKRLGAYASAHRQKRRWLQVLSALAAVVVFVTVYALVLPAATLTADVATMPEGAQVPEGYTHQYTASSDTDGYAVTVYAPDGAVPEGATLKADLLPEDAEKYAEAQQALAADAGEGSDYGFAAFDIRFEDAEGNEVEPTGDVYVVIDAADVIPEDADPASVTVQHLSEDETGAVAEVATVADAADATEGVVASGDDATLQAAFRVDGFSTFTISWNGLFSSYFNVTVSYVDQDGNPIDGTQSNTVSISNGYTIRFSDYAGTIIDYTYTGSYYNSYSNDAVTHMTASQTGSSLNPTRNLTFYNGNDQVAQLTYSSSNGNTKSATVYLVYTKNTSSGGTVTKQASVTTSKVANQHADDSSLYDLTLSITGDQGTTENPQKLDILLVVDKSESMAYNLSKGEGSSRERMIAVESAVKSLTEVLSTNTAVDARYNLITFSSLSYTSADKNTGWTADTSTINEAVSYFTAKNNYGGWQNALEGGTNYQYAISRAKTALRSGTRSDAQQIVIFLTDGIQTHKGINSSQSEERDDVNTDYVNINAAVTEMNGLSADAFYVIGIGSAFTNSSTTDDSATNGMTNLTMLVNKAKNLSIPTGDSPYSTSSQAELEQIFKQIASDSSTFSATNVTVSYPLSEYASLVLDADGDPQFTITVERTASDKAEAKTWTGPDGACTFEDLEGNEVKVNAVYVGPNQTSTLDGKEVTGGSYGTIYLDFPDGYELEPNYNYSVTTVITTSDTANSEGVLSANGQRTPDAGTGTHSESGETGFYCNDYEGSETKAKVTYVSNGEEGSALFPKPVIQVDDSVSVVTPVADPDIRKYVDDNEDGTYDLSLDVTGTTVKQTKSVNVLYILDTSYSMMWDMESEDRVNGVYPYPLYDGDYESNTSGDKYFFYASSTGTNVQDSRDLGPIPYSYYRYNAAKRAIDTLNSALNSDVLDVDVALITFNKAAVDSSTVSWQDLSSFQIANADYSLFASGTNYGSALNTANSVLDAMTDSEKAEETIVIFVTDGNPNRATLEATNSGANTEAALSFAKQYIAELPDFVDRFYAIGVSDEVAQSNLTELINAIPSTSGIESSSFQTADAGDLVQQFAQMAAEIAGTDVHGVTIVDELSQYAELVNVSDSPEISITYTDANGEQKNVDVVPSTELTRNEETGVARQTFTFNDKTMATSSEESSQTLTYTYYPAGEYQDGRNNTYPVVTLQFPEEYRLTDGWTYTIKLQIQPTDAAYSELVDKGTYPDTGDGVTNGATDVPGLPQDQWTSSGKPGFNSNTSASLEYTPGDNPSDTKVYPDPVIQITVEDVTFRKTNDPATIGLPDAQFVLFKKVGDDELFYTKITTTDGSETYAWYTESQIAEATGAEKEVYTSASDGYFTVKGLNVGETYFLREIVAPSGYNLAEKDIQISWNGSSLNVQWVGGNVINSSTDEIAGTPVTYYGITNSTGTALPNTGGIGTTLITMGGIALVAAAGCGYGLRRSRERRGARS